MAAEVQIAVTIMKFMLHISLRDLVEGPVFSDERLMNRKQKNFQFLCCRDLDDRAHWDDFTKAYRSVLARTSTKCAPWYIVPADDKDVRDYLIARSIADTMTRLRLRYPPVDPAIVGLKVK